MNIESGWMVVGFVMVCIGIVVGTAVAFATVLYDVYMNRKQNMAWEKGVREAAHDFTVQRLRYCLIDCKHVMRRVCSGCNYDGDCDEAEKNRAYCVRLRMMSNEAQELFHETDPFKGKKGEEKQA